MPRYAGSGKPRRHRSRSHHRTVQPELNPPPRSRKRRYPNGETLARSLVRRGLRTEAILERSVIPDDRERPDRGRQP